MSDKTKFINLKNTIAIILLLILSGHLYAGFFYPDEIFINANPTFFYISIFIRISFPILILFIIIVYRAVYIGKLKVSSIVLLLFALLFVLLLVYPFGEYFYKKRYRMNLNRYHTFLQLNPPIPSEVDSNYFNIFCLGGSTTEFRDSRGRDWPALTQKLISEKYNIDSIRFYNLGKQWYTTQHTLINYIQNLRKLKPDIILVMHNINDLLINADFSRFSNGNFREDYGHFLGPEALMIKYGSLAEFIFNNLKLLWYRPEPVDIRTDKYPGLVSFRNNLKTLTELARNSDTKIILMTQPNIYKEKMKSEELRSLTMLNKEAIGDGVRWTYETAFAGIKKYNDTIRELSSELNIPLIDLEKIVPKSLEYFYDDVHYTDKTYDLISSYISDELMKVIRQR
ncbi:MAG: SGNH/GDSL hydrolase family protein [Ignavibacterium sp.]|nr:SGNH/GDSL hydrolase family protein [Ignavibacterium sp.]